MNFTPGDAGKAEYAASVYYESKLRRTTARGLHYFALGRCDYPVFNGKGDVVDTRTYRDEDSGRFTTWIALAKRQGLIPWDAIPDESVGEMVLVPSKERCDFSYEYWIDHEPIDEIRWHLVATSPKLAASEILRPQPYRVELWLEKSTMNHLLADICQRNQTTLVTFRGHPSWGAAWKMCKRAQEDGRPTIILYLSDLDPSGFLMAQELAGKVAELNNSFFESGLDIRIRRIGLAPEQVVEHHIPMVNRKTGEKAHEQKYAEYVGKWSLDPTKKAELDALERYHPGGVQAFVEKWLRRFHDPGLERRCRAETSRLIGELPDPPELPQEVLTLRAEIVADLEKLKEIENKLQMDLDRGHVDCKIEVDVETAHSYKWLLSTSEGVYPGDGDVDFVTIEAAIAERVGPWGWGG